MSRERLPDAPFDERRPGGRLSIIGGTSERRVAENTAVIARTRHERRFMAFTDQAMDNPVTRQRILFIETSDDSGGASFEFEWTVAPRVGEDGVPHLHPNAPERFETLFGAARYKLGGEEFGAKPGDVLVLPAGIPRVHPWGVSDEELRCRQGVELEGCPSRRELLRDDVFAGVGREDDKGRNPENLFCLNQNIKPTKQAM